jgi:hypothetical protein
MSGGDLGWPLKVHEVAVQSLLRGGEVLQHRGALPVKPHALHHHAGEESETCEIEAAGADEHRVPAPVVARSATMAQHHDRSPLRPT